MSHQRIVQTAEVVADLRDEVAELKNELATQVEMVKKLTRKKKEGSKKNPIVIKEE